VAPAFKELAKNHAQSKHREEADKDRDGRHAIGPPSSWAAPCVVDSQLHT
jgi:hypothetical protein